MPKVEMPNLPRLLNFGTNQSLTPSAERDQIASITVTKGSGAAEKTHIIFEDGELVEEVHPAQAEFVFNAVVGGAGSMRSSRALGFADWVSTVAEQYGDALDVDRLVKYEAIVEYEKRGGTMVFPMETLVELCQTITQVARDSYERFPRAEREPTRRSSTPDEVEVEITL